jgi:uncharacterized protein (DUF1697 family)
VANTRYVALLRAVNVGKAKVEMARLRKVCESVGCTDVKTYIQSGNVVLTSPLSVAELATTLERAIAAEFGIPSAVMVRTHQQLVDVLAGNPFPHADPSHVHVAFLTKAPTMAELAGLDGLDCAPDEFAVNGTEVYCHFPNGLGRSKLPAQLFDRRLKIPATLRNWRTVTKLADMSAEA